MIDDIKKYLKLYFGFLVALLICTLIHLVLLSCSRKTTTEAMTQTSRTDSVRIAEVITQQTQVTEAWWQADAVKTTYSQPDSTGQQYVTAIATIKASGGKVIHDTIYIKGKDSIIVQTKDSLIYNKVEAVTKNKSHKIVIILSVFFLLAVLLILAWNRLKVFFIK